MVHTYSCKRIARFLPTYIGGPETLLPLFLESALSWAFAIGCLGVALWHYQVDLYRTKMASARMPHSRKHRHQHRQLLPLTTHSRREWLTVSDYEGIRIRYHQLLRIIFTAIVATQTKLPNEEKKDDDDEGGFLDDNEYVIVDGKTCRESQTREHEEQPLSMGEVVAKWLSGGCVVSATSQISPSMPSTKRSNTNNTVNHFDDDSDGLHSRDSRERLIRLIHTNEAARHLASLLLGEDPIDVPVSSTNSASNSSTTKTSKRNNKEKWLSRLASEEPGASALLQTLQEIWPRLLEFPASLSPAHKSDCHETPENVKISVIVPAFREDGGQLAAKLQASLENAIEPHRIEIIIVHVFENDPCPKAENKDGKIPYDNRSSFAKSLREHFVPTTTVQDKNRSESTMSFPRHPELRILEYHGGGGRGPCLNYGAKYARGSILTFLHGDTRLTTRGWDKAISKALEGDESGRPRTTCCAFSFAIDTSPKALTVRTTKRSNSSSDSSHFQQYYPPGLRAIEVTANLRCKFFSLPYGDQCLSLSTDFFRHIGGYPDQCLMEDYELIRLLRMRSEASRVRPHSGALGCDLDQGQETIKILSDYKALCSPRRWQKFGVLYVTFTNSYCVKRYNNGELSPDELFCEYYRTKAPPNRMNRERSPWEIGLHSE